MLLARQCCVLANVVCRPRANHLLTPRRHAGCGLRPFNFERVMEADAKQEHVYELCGRSAVADVLNGHSACVLVYGQTGAGKTHTMFGDGTADPRLGSSRYGIVPRVCEELVKATEARKALGIDAELKVAYVEVFGAEVTDHAPYTRAPLPANASHPHVHRCTCCR